MGKNRKPRDKIVEQIEGCIDGMRQDYADAQVDVRRQNSVSVRIRIIDPAFAKLSLLERDNLAWQYLDSLPKEVKWQITMVLMLTPEEAEDSLSSYDFDSPLKSAL